MLGSRICEPLGGSSYNPEEIAMEFQSKLLIQQMILMHRLIQDQSHFSDSSPKTPLKSNSQVVDVTDMCRFEKDPSKT